MSDENDQKQESESQKALDDKILQHLHTLALEPKKAYQRVVLFNRPNVLFNDFSHSLRYVRAKYGRHVSVSEALFLGYLGSLEKIRKVELLEKEIREVYEDMCKGAEWTDLAFKCKGNVLTVYLDPCGLYLNGANERYLQSNFKYSAKKEFKIPTDCGVNAFGKDFVQFIFDPLACELIEKVKDLQPLIRIKNLPLEEHDIEPVSYRIFDISKTHKFMSIGCDPTYVFPASRSAQKNTTSSVPQSL